MNRQMAALFAMGAALGVDVGKQFGLEERNDSEFVKRSKAFTRRAREGRRMSYSGSTYKRRHLDPTVRGKRAIRHLKRLRVAAMKASGHFRGHNAPFVDNGTVYV